MRWQKRPGPILRLAGSLSKHSTVSDYSFAIGITEYVAARHRIVMAIATVTSLTACVGPIS